MSPPVFGVTGWKNSGKTTLTARLIAEFTARGFRVAAVKHAHHGFDVDQPGRDSHKFREAGAREVAIGSAIRIAIMRELRGEEEPELGEIVARLDAADLVLVEGYKKSGHPKIEARRRESVQSDPLAGNIKGVVAVASDHETDAGGLPLFALDDIAAIADFIASHLGVRKTK